MAANEFCRGVEYDISAVLDRSYKVRSRECVVDNQRDLMCVGDGSQLLDINDIGVRISECLNMDRFCILLNCIFNLLVVERVNKGCCHAVLRKCVC